MRAKIRHPSGANFIHSLSCLFSKGFRCYTSDSLFPLQPPTPPYPDKPPARPTPKNLISVHFGSVWLRFGSVWLRFGSVSGPFRVLFGVLGGVGVGSGRGVSSVREKNITMLHPARQYKKASSDLLLGDFGWLSLMRNSAPEIDILTPPPHATLHPQATDSPSSF